MYKPTHPPPYKVDADSLIHTLLNEVPPGYHIACHPNSSWVRGQRNLYLVSLVVSSKHIRGEVTLDLYLEGTMTERSKYLYSSCREISLLLRSDLPYLLNKVGDSAYGELANFMLRSRSICP